MRGETETRTCTKCGKEKSLSSFYKRKGKRWSAVAEEFVVRETYDQPCRRCKIDQVKERRNRPADVLREDFNVAKNSIEAKMSLLGFQHPERQKYMRNKLKAEADYEEFEKWAQKQRG